ncbi:hypothetical protein ACFOD4_00070 [Pseudoroseomonas globiformis]|uniref:N-acetyltransferase domain-containing protein n=1 Tax=Teichococcus globiformis TaxID=2307229 RepID=A0ABV7FW13_9PROT
MVTATKDGMSELCLWTFQRNAPARRFYERRGFVSICQTDGRDNEEHKPTCSTVGTPRSEGILMPDPERAYVVKFLVCHHVDI